MFYPVYVDLLYDENSLTITAVSVSLYCVCCHVVVLHLSVRLSWYLMDAVVAVTVMRVLLFVLHVWMLRECEGAGVTGMLVWEMGGV